MLYGGMQVETNWGKQFGEIPGCHAFVRVEPFKKGLSGERKYYVEAAGDVRLILRIAEASAYEENKSEYELLLRLTHLGIPASRPVAFGICEGGRSVYQLLTWVDGTEVETLLPTLTESEQYALGAKAGLLLKTIHAAIPDKITPADFARRFNAKMDRRVQRYLEYRGNRQTSAAADIFFEYVSANRNIPVGCRHGLLHGDYHAGNLIAGKTGLLSAIDWGLNRTDDPWEDFARIIVSAESSPTFVTGQIEAYFGGAPEKSFWSVLSLYVASHMLEIIGWEQSFGDGSSFAEHQHKIALMWYNNMRQIIPSCYYGDF